jgi:PAS domain S-box-containing protein
VTLNSLELQLATAMQRFNTLQRRVDADSGESTSLVSRALHELERALEEVRVAQDQLIDNRSRMEQLHEELAQQYRKYADLFDEMPQPYIVTRSDTTITEANRAAAEFLNVSPRFLVGKTLSVFVCENRTQFLQDSGSARASGRRSTSSRQCAGVQGRSAGCCAPFTLRSRPRRSNAGCIALPHPCRKTRRVVSPLAHPSPEWRSGTSVDVPEGHGEKLQTVAGSHVAGVRLIGRSGGGFIISSVFFFF